MGALEVGRRDFLATKLAAGFALAVQPVVAGTITTDTAGILAGEIQILSGNDEIPAYRAHPASGKAFPTILVIQEIFGVHEHIKDVCRRLSKAGYLALAPEMYFRQGDVSKLANVAEIQKIVAAVPDTQVLADLDATVLWAGKNGGDTSKLGVTGFCWGGRQVWLYSAHNAKCKAGVAWYGRLTTAPTTLAPKSPLAVAGSLKAPVLGLYGGQDAGIPVSDVEKMRQALKSGSGAAQKSAIHVYPAAPHGFHADYRDSYREADATDAWKRALEWFRGHGV